MEKSDSLLHAKKFSSFIFLCWCFFYSVFVLYYVPFGEFARCCFRCDKTEHLRCSSNQQWNNKFIQSPSNNVMLSTFMAETLLRMLSTKASHKQNRLKKFAQVFFLVCFTFAFTFDIGSFFSSPHSSQTNVQIIIVYHMILPSKFKT